MFESSILVSNVFVSNPMNGTGEGLRSIGGCFVRTGERLRDRLRDLDPFLRGDPDFERLELRLRLLLRLRLALLLLLRLLLLLLLRLLLRVISPRGVGLRLPRGLVVTRPSDSGVDDRLPGGDGVRCTISSFLSLSRIYLIFAL